MGSRRCYPQLWTEPLPLSVGAGDAILGRSNGSVVGVGAEFLELVGEPYATEAEDGSRSGDGLDVEAVW